MKLFSVNQGFCGQNLGQGATIKNPFCISASGGFLFGLRNQAANALGSAKVSYAYFQQQLEGLARPWIGKGVFMPLKLF